jgi:O-antigen/teichoic acid export membrane protein
MPPTSLSANVSWMLASNIVYAICQWMMLVVLARTSSLEVVGLFALALAITAPVFMFAQLQLRTVQATDVRQLYRFREYLQVRLLAMCCAFGTVLVICVIAGYGQPVISAAVAVSIWKCLDGCSDILHGLFQQHERMRIISTSMMLKGLLSLAGFAAVLFFSGDLIWALSSLVLASTVVLIGYDIPMCHRLRHEYTASLAKASDRRYQRSPRRLGSLVWLALPLGLVQLLVAVSANAPRYFLEHWRGTREVGIFAALAYFITAGQVVVTALQQAALPRLARFASLDLKAYQRLMVRLIGVGLLLGVGGIVVAVMFGPIVLRYSYGPAYEAHNRALVWMMISAAVAYLAWLLGTAMTAARIFRPQFPLLACSTAATMIACACLVPRGGIEGGALAFGFGMLVQAGGTAVIVGNWMRRRRADVPSSLPGAVTLTEFAICDRS